MKRNKYFIKTFGCQMNNSDSERIAGFLESHECKSAKNIAEADLVIFNTCGVRQSAEDRAYGQIHNLRKSKIRDSKFEKKKIIILTGCLANRKDVQRRLRDKVDLFCEIKNFPKEIKKLIKFHSEFVEGPNSKKELDSSTFPPAGGSAQNDISYFSIKPKYSAKHTAYVPIMTGCNNFCSYCVVPYARGREISRPAYDIIKEIKSLAKNGVKEIMLLGQNVNSYIGKIKNQKSKIKIAIENSKSINPRLIENWKLEIGNSDVLDFALLLDLLASLHPNICFKFLSSHPKDFSDALIKVIAKNKNIYREIHLPVQAGSDKILRAMNRPYTQKYFLQLVKKIKKAMPEIGFTTDVIVGFPGETRKDFAESVKIFKKVGFNEAYISKYSPRPGTLSYKIKETVSIAEKKRREKILRSLISHEKKK